MLAIVTSGCEELTDGARLLKRLLELVGLTELDSASEEDESGRSALVESELTLSSDGDEALLKDDDGTSSEEEDSPSEVDEDTSEGNARSQLVKTMARKPTKRMGCFML